MRVIVRKERPHPGAQLRFTDVDGHRFTAFATDAKKGQLSNLELRHRRRARCEDRIRNAKDTGLRNLPLKGFAHNQVWCEIVALACELLAWTQMLALRGQARRWEPKRLRLRLLSAAGRPPAAAPPRARWPWADEITAAVTRLQTLPSADQPQPPPRQVGASPRGRGPPPTRRYSRAAKRRPQRKSIPAERLRRADHGREIEARHRARGPAPQSAHLPAATTHRVCRISRRQFLLAPLDVRQGTGVTGLHMPPRSAVRLSRVLETGLAWVERAEFYSRTMSASSSGP
jgi:Transposase DDE domain group 1